MKEKPTVKLVGCDGNAFFILGKVNKVLRESGMKEEAKKFIKEATAGDYNNLLRVAKKYVNID